MVYASATQHGDAGTQHMKFSNDYGATWTNPDKYLDGSDVVNATVDGEPYLFDVSNGDLIRHIGRGWTAAEGTLQTRSTDGGKTWSVAAPITITGIVGNTNYLNLIDDHFNYGGVTYLSGRISTNAGEANVKSVLCKSTDNGATWEWVSDISAAGQANEVGIEYVGSNRIIAVMRDAANVNTHRAISDDMGLTWTVDTITSQIGRIGKPRIYTKTHIENGATWWTDAKMIMCGFEFTGGNRINCVWLSTDAGQTWSYIGHLDTQIADAGYGDLFYNPDTGRYICENYQGTTLVADVKQYVLEINWNL